MKWIFNLMVVTFFVFSFSGMVGAQELKVGPDTVFDGGNNFAGFTLSDNICSSFFLVEDKTPIAYEDLFSYSKELEFVGSKAQKARINVEVVEKDLYFDSGMGYKFLPSQIRGPKIEVSESDLDDSILEDIIYISPQTINFTKILAESLNLSYLVEVPKLKEIEFPDGRWGKATYTSYEPRFSYENLTMKGFFYVFSYGEKFLHILDYMSIPYLLTSDSKIVVRVGGDKQEATYWMLKYILGFKGLDETRTVD